MKILADKCPDVRCFNRFLSVKVLFSNIVKSTNYREIWHLYCSLLILSLPPFLWVSPAEILSSCLFVKCRGWRITETGPPTSYILPPSDSSSDSIFQSFSLDNFPVRGEEQDCGDLYQHSLLFLWSIKWLHIFTYSFHSPPWDKKTCFCCFHKLCMFSDKDKRKMLLIWTSDISGRGKNTLTIVQGLEEGSKF